MSSYYTVGDDLMRWLMSAKGDVLSLLPHIIVVRFKKNCSQAIKSGWHSLRVGDTEDLDNDPERMPWKQILVATELYCNLSANSTARGQPFGGIQSLIGRRSSWPLCTDNNYVSEVSTRFAVASATEALPQMRAVWKRINKYTCQDYFI